MEEKGEKKKGGTLSLTKEKGKRRKETKRVGRKKGRFSNKIKCDNMGET